MRITAHPFHYAAACTSCGNAITVSYADLRRCFSGALPDRARMERSLIYICDAAARPAHEAGRPYGSPALHKPRALDRRSRG